MGYLAKSFRNEHSPLSDLAIFSEIEHDDTRPQGRKELFHDRCYLVSLSLSLLLRKAEGNPNFCAKRALEILPLLKSSLDMWERCWSCFMKEEPEFPRGSFVLRFPLSPSIDWDPSCARICRICLCILFRFIFKIAVASTIFLRERNRLETVQIL